jgi:hypothetical protein
MNTKSNSNEKKTLSWELQNQIRKDLQIPADGTSNAIAISSLLKRSSGRESPYAKKLGVRQNTSSESLDSHHEIVTEDTEKADKLDTRYSKIFSKPRKGRPKFINSKKPKGLNIKGAKIEDIINRPNILIKRRRPTRKKFSNFGGKKKRKRGGPSPKRTNSLFKKKRTKKKKRKSSKRTKRKTRRGYGGPSPKTYKKCAKFFTKKHKITQKKALKMCKVMFG